MSVKKYIVAGCKPWSREVYDSKISHYPGEWFFIAEKEELNTRKLEEIKPEYIFFLHWSWIVPQEITDNFRCVCFHMTDLPYGRGGSPLQNLIARGHKSTRLSAIKMLPELDAGPIYMKRELSLEGSAENIYLRANILASEMIGEITGQNIIPLEQTGEPVIFERRKPEESRIPQNIDNMEKLYDFIRMLDAPSYPKAFMETDKFRIEFEKAEMIGEKELEAKIRISFRKDKEK